MVNLALAVLFSAHVPLIWEALVCIHHVLHSVQAICDSAYPLVADPCQCDQSNNSVLRQYINFTVVAPSKLLALAPFLAVDLSFVLLAKIHILRHYTSSKHPSL